MTVEPERVSPIFRPGPLLAWVFAVVVGLLPFSAAAESACREDRVQIRGDWGEAAFTGDVADTMETRARGLMFVEHMPRGKGMLFVFERPQRTSFWMKNTLIPLDMLFVDRTGLVRRVHENAIPHDETSIPGGDDILVVLEINGGLSNRFGIDEGSVMRHPAFDQTTARWPC